MKYLKKITDIYLKSSLHVALAVTAFVLISGEYQDIPVRPDLLLFIFSGTVIGYNFIKYFQLVRTRLPELHNTIRPILVISSTCLLILILTAWYRPLLVLSGSAVLGLVTILYAVPFWGDKQNLRSVTGIKIFIIAAVWTGVTVLLPLFDTGKSFPDGIYLIAIQRFLFVIVLTLPFDIRDFSMDSESLGTIPQQFGIQATRLIGLSLLAAVIVLEYVRMANNEEILATVIISAITAYFVLKSEARQNRYFAAFWVEGIPVLWYGLLLFLKVV